MKIQSNRNHSAGETDMRKLLILSCVFLLISCTQNYYASNKINGTNYGSENWGIVNSWHYCVTSGYERKYDSEFHVEVELFDVACSQGKTEFIFIFVPFSLPRDCDDWCAKRSADRENRTIEVMIRDSDKIAQEKFKIWKSNSVFDPSKIYRNKYTFDPSKSYFLKDGQKYHLGNPLNTEAKIHDINSTHPRTTVRGFTYSFPFICGELENTVLVIDGLSANGQPMDPLMIKLNYIDPTKVPFYSGSK